MAQCIVNCYDDCHFNQRCSSSVVQPMYRSNEHSRAFCMGLVDLLVKYRSFEVHGRMEENRTSKKIEIVTARGNVDFRHFVAMTNCVCLLPFMIDILNPFCLQMQLKRKDQKP